MIKKIIELTDIMYSHTFKFPVICSYCSSIRNYMLFCPCCL